jgi:hypothetical protein
MPDEMDFPPSPALGQDYTAPSGVVYTWDGYGWIIGYYDTSTEAFQELGDLLSMIRTLLQDTDLLGSEYRYSTDSLVANINMGLMEMYRIRPDIFLELNFKVPIYNDAELGAPITIEPQHVPALVYYAVGMAQLRDDEGTQDSRASSFLAKFTSMLVAVA